MDAPVAVVEQQRIRAVSAEARAEGVRIGVRRREAEATCPGIVVLDADVAAEARAFEPVARAVEAITPRLVVDRPGILAFPTRDPPATTVATAVWSRDVGGRGTRSR